MSIVVTDQGLQAIRNADAGGFLIDLTDFKLTEETNFTPNVLDNTLAGNPIYTGKISNIEALGSSSIKLTLSLPKNFPTSGSVFISEVGIYLVSGELFAHGKLSSPFEKTSEFGFDIYVIVSAARLGDVINVTDARSCSIAATPHVRTLLSPQESLQNAVSVLDEGTDYRGNPTGSLAVKFGSGSIHWSFIGYHRVFSGSPGSVTNSGSFNLDIETQAGFWLNDNEIVIVQVISGPGAGESRKVRYNKISSFTVLEKNFSSLSSQSVVSIWRKDYEVLPSRDPSIPDHFMLMKGTNTWGEQVTLAPAGALLPYRFSVRGNGTDFLDIPVSTISHLDTLVTPESLTVHRNGKVVSPSQYALLYNAQGRPYKIQFASATLLTETYDILIFSYDATSTGASVYLYEAVYSANAETTFALPIIPDTVEGGLLAYLDGELVTNYTIVGASAVFSSPVVGELALVPFASYKELGISARLHRVTVTATSGQLSVGSGTTISQKKDTLVYVNGKYVKKDLYKIQNNTDILFNEPLASGDLVDITVFYSDIVTPISTTVSGRDTGPVWADPAGAYSPPNAISVKHFSGLTDGSTPRFEIDKVLDKDHVWIFVQGEFQYPSEFSLFQFSDHSVVSLNEALDAGLEVDVFGFYESPSSGEHVRGVVTRFTTASYTLYSFPPPLGLLDDSWIVFQDGVYQHRSQYTYNAATGALTFTSVEAGHLIEFFCLASTPTAGYRTDIGSYISALDSSSARNQFKYVPESVESSMVFIGSVYQNKDRYSLQTSFQGRPVGYAQFDPAPSSYMDGTEVCTIAIRSALPETRLVLRDEFQACCDSVWSAISSMSSAGSSGGSGSGTGGSSSTQTFRFAAAAGQVAFDTHTVLSSNVSVSVRGVELAPDDYSVAGSVVTILGMSLPSGTPVVVRDFGLPGSGGGTSGASTSTITYRFTASQGQTAYDTLATLSNNLSVTVRGTELALSDFSVSGSVVTLSGQVNVPAGVEVVVRDFGAVVSGTSTQSSYVLPVATSVTLGGIKVGPGLSIDNLGILTTTGLGVGQAWQDVTSSRSLNTSYKNTSGKVMAIIIRLEAVGSSASVLVSPDNVGWVTLDVLRSDNTLTTILPSGHYIQVVPTPGNAIPSILRWLELK